MTDPPLQLVHLYATEMTMTLIAEQPDRWDYIKYTCCGKNVEETTVWRVVHSFTLCEVTCEDCLSGYALSKLADLP